MSCVAGVDSVCGEGPRVNRRYPLEENPLGENLVQNLTEVYDFAGKLDFGAGLQHPLHV